MYYSWSPVKARLRSKSYATFSVYDLGHTFEFHYSSESSSVCKSITSTNGKCASIQSNYTEVFPREWQVCRMVMNQSLSWCDLCGDSGLNYFKIKEMSWVQEELIKLRYCNLLNIIKTG